ncbi:hypothetical protein COL516b_003401 [Colletotrichum fioriniae]|nr:uncharacterized protein COL516b_003401 [Colletotrichum fioriniae]KAJ0308847.1 hypothetical protein COL516b_003401 [Colletotrichum fioriniae]
MPSIRNTASDVPDMNLYKLNRVHRTLEKLEEKKEWEADDTKSFDCMHYLGDSAIETAAKSLGLQAGERVLDIGSGFGGTGRYFYRHFDATTAGIELQKEIHDIAQTINEKSGAGTNATSINGNFLELDPAKMEREVLFKKAHSVLKPRGKMYIEDFFARTSLDAKTLEVLRSSVSCLDLPDKEHYIAELEKAGFEVTDWVDMSTVWTDFVHERAEAYKKDPSIDADLTAFYDAVDEVFSGGQVGGTRITCQRK